MQIGFVLFPNLTQLDFTGPLQVLHRLPGASTHLIAQTMDPVGSDCGLSLLPTCTFEDSPPLDILCIPGGFGVSEAILNQQLLDFVRHSAHAATYVTSVCTGAFVLGVAGALVGKRATTHWAYHDLLKNVGAVPIKERVVRDGHLFTGGGVTAGIDFAFALVEEIAGTAVAQRIQLALEYQPEAPRYPILDDHTIQPVLSSFDHRRQDFSISLNKALLATRIVDAVTYVRPHDTQRASHLHDGS